MKRLTPLEHARAKGKIIAMSTSDRGPEARARMIAWLEQRPSDGWFYASGDNFYFSAAVDANAFKQRLIPDIALHAVGNFHGQKTPEKECWVCT